ncbi:WG repeat-containing protein [uncultured Flavonifractor sp.]|uniref:WG repeat-containing protein n=1 Tax=Candidatus Flavonifractor intestinigallinarum TaxID=2838586 RepID=A0A9D2MNW1_9FIRM|nr:WG repeat-containing protein [uncultured Flavonifractor sp.]HJB81118.1 WG repeat-containing protein [Candidatus Flavonifractor intestinigallinarum]
MKKRLSSVLLAMALSVSVLAVPAFAVDTNTFWQDNAEVLATQNIFQYGERPFREGLIPVLVNDEWNYLNEQAQVVDLNRGRFSYMFDFFDGRAAVIDKNTNKVGYIDKTGTLVIPCQFGYHDMMGTVYTGYFHNGQATVLKEYYPAEEDFSNGFPMMTSGTWEVAHIDKNGQLVDSYRTVEGMSAGLYLIGDNGYMIDQTETVTEPTYGQSTVKIKGYTIDEDYVGKMLIEVTNNGDAPDKGDLFYVAYSKFMEGSTLIDAGAYVPNDLILQIQYEVDANATKTLEVPMGFLPEDNNLTEDQMEHGWTHAENIESSRTVLAQAETPEEAAELTEFFKAAHDYGEMELTYAPDSNGVTILAKPMSTTQRARYLDQKLSAFTSQF